MKLFDLKKDDYFCFEMDMAEYVLPIYRVFRQYNQKTYETEFFNVRTGSFRTLDWNPEVHKLELELKWRFHDNG